MNESRDANEGITTDACLSLLADARRRAVLLSVYDRDPDDPIPVEEAFTDPITERAEVTLTHNHLPKLADHDVVRWDREKGTVARGPAFGEIEPFIERLDDGRERLPDDWRSGPER
jgi:hypothetical protein